MKKKYLCGGFVIIGGTMAVLTSIFLSPLTWQQHLIGVIPGLLLMLIARLSHGQIGIGDGMVICITGFALGLERNMVLFLYALTITAFIAGTLLIFKRLRRGQSLPFVPFILVGYVLELL